MVDPAESYVGLQYLGLAGTSSECLNGVMRLLQYGDSIKHVRILSCENAHCLLLTVNAGDLIVIGSGFSSGYGGEGPRTFSQALRLLDKHGAEIDEIVIEQEILDRIDSTSLTKADVEEVTNARPVRPSRWYRYIWDEDRQQSVWDIFPPVIPFAIVDVHIIDLAINFWIKPGDHLLTAYKRLEDIVRKRIKSQEYGQKLFSQAFAGDNSKLTWRDLNGSEQQGRANLFIGAYMAYRNPRAHRELSESSAQQLTEFLMLSHLYSLERSAELRPGIVSND